MLFVHVLKFRKHGFKGHGLKDTGSKLCPKNKKSYAVEKKK